MLSYCQKCRKNKAKSCKNKRRTMLSWKCAVGDSKKSRLEAEGLLSMIEKILVLGKLFI